MKTNFRTNYCATFNESNQGEEVSITGWSSTVRDHGGVIFIDVRDRSGIIQIVSDPELFPEAHNTIEKIRNEFVINVKGKIRLRSDNSVNPKLPTGKIEILAESVEIFNTCVPLPFQIEDEIDTDENIRLKYRYLDLRRPSISKNFEIGRAHV